MRPRVQGALWILLLLPALSSAHGEHAASEPPGAITVERWETALRAFTATGAPEHLRNAQTLSAALEPGSACTAHCQYLAAWTAQAGHRFARARTLVDTLLRAQPGHVPAQLLSVSLWLIQGNHQQARATCNQLRSADPLLLLTCRAQSLPAPTVADYRKLLKLYALAPASAQDPSLLAWQQATLADLAQRAEQPALALKHYAAATSLQPSVRYLAAQIDALLSLRRFEQVLALLADQPPALNLQVKRLVALNALGDLDRNQSAVVALAQAFAADRVRQDFQHGREMAEFYLLVQGDADTALRVLERSMAQQREFEDQRLHARISKRLNPGSAFVSTIKSP